MTRTPHTAVTALLLLSALALVPVQAQAPKKGERVPNQYIVVLKETGALGGMLSADQIARIARELAGQHGGTLLLTYGNALNGYIARLDATQAAALARDPRVSFVEQDSVVGPVTRNQRDPVWGLDRLDQRGPKLDEYYRYPDTAGFGVNLYIIDSGVRSTHQDFRDRYGGGVNFVSADRNPGAAPGGDPGDCNGHGTHVAGTAAGEKYGVAKRAKLYSVRVLDCDGSGTMAGVIAGVDWLEKNARRPAVANLSLGGGASRALDQAVQKLINRGVVVVAAAGNDDRDACGVSPGRVKDVLTVAASDREDRRAQFSNWGECVDLFAPGADIRSAWFEKDNQFATLSGTSMAAPHVAGLAALYLGERREARVTEVVRDLLRDASDDRIADPKGSPNRLAYVGRVGQRPPDAGERGGQNQPQGGVLDQVLPPVLR